MKNKNIELVSSKKIYIVRHGQTDYNAKSIVQGSGIDSDLNEEGYRQADKLYEKYKNHSFSKIYISKLKRTQQTVQQFINAGIPYEALRGLNELNWGVKEGKEFLYDDNTYYKYIIKEWQNGNTSMPVEGGESPEELQGYQRQALDYILAQEDNGDVLIAMHGRAIRIFLCLLLGEDLKEMDGFLHSNTSIYVVSYEEGRFSLEVCNDLSHLD